MRRFIQQRPVYLLIALLSMSLPSLAAEDQFYFIAKTVDTSTNRQVYLRWDAIETDLPSDIVAFRLLRNGERVDPAIDWPTNAVKSVADIAALYQGPDQQRRKLETITRLNEIASDAGMAFSANQFAVTLHDLVDPGSATYNPLWAFLGSRTDFNIARARYRGWIDTNPVPAGTGNLANYELLGVTAAGGTVRLGLVQIDPTAQQQILGATELRQIRITDWRCDLPENSKDQYTVMLDWKAPGSRNVTDRVAAQALLSGFDLYRGTENLAADVLDAPALDVAALAAASSVDSRGRPIINGLEKVNVPLIMDSGAPAIDPEWLEARQRLIEGGETLPTIPDDRIPMEPKWLEARDQLIRAGLKPGDRRAYYLVSRDFTGNYGPSVGAVVEIPLMTRPPAPWNLRSFADETSAVLNGSPDALTFTWDEVNLDNYVKFYQGTRLFCNLIAARSSGILEYVAVGENCATGNRNAVRLDVPNYRIYRFTDFDVAGRFKDSDGDGVEDSVEIPDIDGNGRTDAFERSAGLQCDDNAQPPGAYNYLVWPAANSSVGLAISSATNSTPEVARMRDTVPAGNKDAVYWYRVVSEASLLPYDVNNKVAPYVGRLSFMSAPQRGLFPDREPPPEPIVEITKPGENIDGCEIVEQAGQPWAFSESVIDAKAGFRLSCSASTYAASNVSQVGQGSCPQIVNDCGGQQNVILHVDASPLTGGQACDVPISDDINFCETDGGALTIRPAYERIAVLPGELVLGGPRVSVRPPNSRTCIAFFENIDGTATRIGSTCDVGGITYTPRPGLFCGYAVATDENNNISNVVQYPCTITPPHPKAPSPPQVLTLNVDNDLARFTFRLPAEQVAVALARLDHDPGAGSNERKTETISVIDNEPGEPISYSMPVAGLQGTRDRFCLSLLSVGRDDGTGDAFNSAWSTEKCFTRTNSGEDLPKYLPWPDVQGAVQGEPLQAALVTDYRSVTPFLTFLLTDAANLVSGGASSISDCWIPDPVPFVTEEFRRDFDSYSCFSGGYAKFNATLAPHLNFIVYRQSRVVGGNASDWIQVSPLIEFAHFDRSIVTLGDTDYTLYSLNDPYVKTSVRTLVGDLSIWFVDQYPFLISADVAATQPYEWRYQVVYFDSEHRPVRWRGSDWFRSE